MNQQYYDPYISNPQVVQQQIPVSQDEMYANMLQEERVKNIIQQISPDSQLGEIEMRIKGYRKDLRTGEWIKVSNNMREPHPVLIGRLISYLSSLLNQNTSLSNLTEMQINKIMGLVIEYIVDDLDVNAEEYGLLTDYTERTRIGHIICNSVFMVLNRALNGQEARRMWGTLNLTESLKGDTPKKAGLMDALAFWR